jgi:polyhydroxyalkanoate synthesis repressor PhaR
MSVLIKRYANRKLYNTESSRYITLKGISELVRDKREIRVVDNETGEDITSYILSLILVDDQKPQGERPAVPGRVLTDLIQRSSEALYGMLRRSVDDAQENLQEMRHRFMGAGPREPEGAADLSRVVHQAVERVLKLVDLPTRSDLEALNKNLDRLAVALEQFERRVAALERSSEPER